MSTAVLIGVGLGFWLAIAIASVVMWVIGKRKGRR